MGWLCSSFDAQWDGRIKLQWAGYARFMYSELVGERRYSGLALLVWCAVDRWDRVAQYAGSTTRFTPRGLVGVTGREEP